VMSTRGGGILFDFEELSGSLSNAVSGLVRLG